MCQGQTLDDESSSFIYQATRRFIEEAAPLADLPERNNRSILNGGWLLGEYFEDRINDPYEIMWKDGKPMAELLVEGTIVDKSDLKINLFGTIDAVFRNQANQSIVPCDHKTAGTLNYKFFNRLKPNHQYTAYLWLVQNILKIDTDNFMVNAFETKLKPIKATTAGPSFLHQITKRTEEDMQEFIETLEANVRLYLGWVSADQFPLGPVDACANYGQCSFLDVCSSPSSIRESILENNYRRTQ
jgi:hypothetical protein